MEGIQQYINKTKIEEILRSLWKKDDNNPEHRIYYNKALQEVQCQLDTIEAEEEILDDDLEEELNKWRHNHFHGKRDDKGASGEYLTRVSQLEIARYFYELGVKSQKVE